MNRDDPQDENRLISERRDKLNSLRGRGNAFPNQWRRTHLALELEDEFRSLDKSALADLSAEVSIAGRIMAKRGPFLVIQDVSGRIQAYADKGVQEALKERFGTWDIGDIVGICGPLRRSDRGDLYVELKSYDLLTKSLRPLPEKHAGLVDTEQRYRQRYVDLIVNEDTRKVFIQRSRITDTIRTFFIARDYLEVETPMLQMIPGGATARPFVTHHNALDQDMYLRIAPELYLKRLVVGGFERVFEIAKNFRNEGLSTRHNPEFTMLEFYQAYTDFHDLMDLLEDLFRTLVQQVRGSRVIENHQVGTSDMPVTFDFSAPFQRIPLEQSLLEQIPGLKQAHLRDPIRLASALKEIGINAATDWGIGRLQLELFENCVEHKLIQPTFITAYPAEVSPLARRNDQDDFVTDRFELFIGGREIANGFSELNDAEDQATRFREQAVSKDAGDLEAMHYDGDYIRALEFGLPPTAGAGVGIDRLAMLLTDQPSIRDVILFPAMRPEH